MSLEENNTIDWDKLAGKIAADKQSKKLGKVMKVEMIQDKKTNLPKPYLLILVKKFLQDDIVIVIDAKKILRTDDFHVWLDLFKEDFEQEVRETRALIKFSS